MGNFLLGKSNFFNCLKKPNFRKFAGKTQYSFVKLPEKLKFFGNLPVEIEIFLTRIHDPPYFKLDSRRCCYPSLNFSVASSEIGDQVAEFLDLFYNFPCNYYLHYLILILCLLSRLLSFQYLVSCCNSLTPYSI